MSKWSVDIESFSEGDLTKLGAFRYANDSTTELLLFSISKDDGEPEIWDRYASDEDNAPALNLIAECSNDTGEVHAFNALFEIACSTYLWLKTFHCPPPALTRWRCSQALGRTAGLPQSLGAVAEFLQLDAGKDKAGKALIGIFSVMRKSKAKGLFRTYPTDKGKVTVAGESLEIADAWVKYREYNKQDVRVEQTIGKRLKPLELKGWILEGFLLDLKMNMLGVPIDIDGVTKAEKIVDAYKAETATRFKELTGLNPTQGVKFKEWLVERGYPGADLRAGTVSRILTGVETDDDGEEIVSEGAPETSAMTDEAVEALTMASLLNYSALKKLVSMRRTVCDDNRVRGVLKWHGAVRTGRHSSGLIQVQNMRKATVKDTDSVYAFIRSGHADAESLELLYGSPLECVASTIRHYINPGEGRKFCDVDYSQVEARVLPWVAGHQELLQGFREGKDLYSLTYASTFNVPFSEVTKANRTVGKVIVLACGFMGGVNAVTTACEIYRIEMTEDQKKEVVKKYRENNVPIKKFWKQMGAGAAEAIRNPGTWVVVNDKIRFGVTKNLGYPALVMGLPSKRRLQYPLPEIREIYKRKNAKTEKWEDIPAHRAFDAENNVIEGVWVTDEITYWGQIRGSSQWGRIKTHQGVLTENCVQAIAGDLLMQGSIEADRQGFDLVMPIHDQLITEYHPDRGNTVEKLVDALCTIPPWARDFPLNAVGNLTDYYTKD